MMDLDDLSDKLVDSDNDHTLFGFSTYAQIPQDCV